MCLGFANWPRWKVGTRVTYPAAAENSLTQSTSRERPAGGLSGLRLGGSNIQGLDAEMPDPPKHTAPGSLSAVGRRLGAPKLGPDWPHQDGEMGAGRRGKRLPVLDKPSGPQAGVQDRGKVGALSCAR